MATRSSKNVTAATQTRNQFKKYALYGWGLPLCLVFTFVVLDLSDVVVIGYGEKHFESDQKLFLKVIYIYSRRSLLVLQSVGEPL